MQKIIIAILLITSFLYSLSTEGLEKACENEISTACYELGLLYEQGIGIDKNITKAIELYKNACELGLDISCKKVTKIDNKS